VLWLLLFRATEMLCWTDNSVGEAGGAAFARALEKNSTLQSLDLCGEFDAFWSSLADFGISLVVVGCCVDVEDWAEWRALWLLWLGNSVGEAGGAAFARALQKNSTLQALHLGGQFVMFLAPLVDWLWRIACVLLCWRWGLG
jgi:hypothetical protein